jgi:hypothetical protein
MEGRAELPGAELVEAGIADLRAGRDTTSAALVGMARPRLRALGIEVPDAGRTEPAGHHLYGLLVADEATTAHSRYNALVARIVSFARAAEHASPGQR